MTNPKEILRAKVNLETAQMPWREMQRYFASGAAIFVSPELDLVETAYQMSEDNAPLISQWMAAGQFGKVTDEQAQTWWDADAVLWAVVVSPWVLVQPAGDDN
ncbi:MAG TPA: DUF2288 domain-containing protein [Gallionella sp.]|nr:MAG: hypothetical protein A2Z87_10600 [Gallionellales bacterium GWA2_54_124]OGT17451.1 MAG: hypothetical protein A2522_07230 [Gallionellales bacterium RIFOXYD12_FULL_53_10]OGT32833.1 MAG: hypothetical protein A3K00_05630 [Gallionellales bacterium RIFOXYD2_FULL_52_7]HCI54011.1 DUF2288 domain-containing protein [Gallionella sp.]